MYIPHNYNYTGPSSLVKTLHSFPHLLADLTAYDVNPDNVVEDTHGWGESLGVIAAIFIAVLVIELLVELFQCIFSCFQQCCCPKRRISKVFCVCARVYLDSCFVLCL